MSHVSQHALQGQHQCVGGVVAEHERPDQTASCAVEQKGRQEQKHVPCQFDLDTRGGNQIMMYTWGEYPFAVEPPVSSHVLGMYSRWIDTASSDHSEQL